MFRIYTPQPCALQASLVLSAEESNHILTVLRHQIGDRFTLFNGQGGEYTAVITDIQKKTAIIELTEFFDISRESPPAIHLFHGLARGEKMDWIIQKATELGVQTFTPLITEKCQVTLTTERTTKKMEHWRRIIIHSAEQCGRNQLMTLKPLLECQTAMRLPFDIKLICEPRWPETQILTPTNAPIALFIGGESGFSASELALAQTQQLRGFSLGPRILRTETAAIVAVTRLHMTATACSNSEKLGT